jgi:chaperonin GroL
MMVFVFCKNIFLTKTLSSRRLKSIKFCLEVPLVVQAGARDIIFDNDSRARLQVGINKCVDAIAITLGPRGRNVVLEQTFGVPQVINDGVSIARAIELPDPVENAGAQLVKEVAGKTNDLAGDGTTTASVLARELIKFGLQAVTAGSNPMNIKKGIDKTCDFLISKLKEHSKHVEHREDVKNVATISAGNDASIGQMIAEALDRVGSDGVLSIETSNSFETNIEVQEGMEIDRGYISPQFVTNTERSVTEYENCRVMVADEKISDVRELIPILERITQANQPLLIVTEDITGEALATLVVNKLRGILHVVGVKAPGFGERRKALLQDIAIVTGAEYIAKDLGMKVAQASLEQLGFARKIKVTSGTCTIIADQANSQEISMRIAQIKKELLETDSVYDTEKLSERIAKLAGGIAVIKVGGFTEAEVEDRKLRIEDAKNATFAAVEEGIVPGGGTALLHLSELLPKFKNTLFDDEEKQGVDIVAKALRSPCRIIAQNAGVEGDVIVEAVLGLPFAIGYNAMENNIENLVEKGIIDPAKVTRNGLQNSCSIAGVMLTTQAVMFELPKSVKSGKITKDTYGLTNSGLPSSLTI